MKFLASVFCLIAILFASQAMAIEAHWEFGLPAPDDAFGYTLQWGLADGVYTGTLETLKSACVSGTDNSGTYDCKATVSETGFVIGTKYYFEVKSFNYSEDGLTKQESVGGAKAQYIHREPGSTGGSVPKNPTGLGIYPTNPTQ